jgi:hypothetical protein
MLQYRHYGYGVMKHKENKTLEFQLLDTARSHLVNICLITLLITGFAVLPMQISRVINSGLNPVSINHFFILSIGTPIILLRKKFSLLIRTITLLGISLLSSYFGLFSFGIVGSGFFGMGLVGCTVAALVIGKWLGFTILVLSAFIFLAFTQHVFYSESSIIIPVLQRYVSTKGAWYNALSGFVLPVFMLIMGIDEMHKILRQYIKKIDISGRELDRENRFRAALFNTTDSFVIITDSCGNITDINSACENLPVFLLRRLTVNLL